MMVRLPRAGQNGLARHLLVLLGAGSLLLSACSAGSQSVPGASGPSAQQPSQALKTLRIGTIKEPVMGIAVSPGSGGNIALQHSWMFHQGLTTYDGQGNLQPAVASKVPSLADGD